MEVDVQKGSQTKSLAAWEFSTTLSARHSNAAARPSAPIARTRPAGAGVVDQPKQKCCGGPASGWDQRRSASTRQGDGEHDSVSLNAKRTHAGTLTIMMLRAAVAKDVEDGV